MPKTPLVSIIVPAFNAAGVIPDALASVRNQTFEDFETIIVDDGSTDGTVAVARSFCATDARFSLLQRVHSGVSVARNAALARARGQWIAFQDADDIWLPQKLERQVELSRQDPRANFLFTNFFYWDGVSDLYLNYAADRLLPEGDPAHELVLACVYGNLTVMVKRDLVLRAGLFDPAFVFAQDWDLWLRIAELGLWARGTREPLARYRRWPGNQTRRKLDVAEWDVRVLEKNSRATRRAQLRPIYARSLAAARTRLQCARARSLLESHPEAVPAAVWRAWRLNPRHLKWLLWFVLVAWPKSLGGCATAPIAHRKIFRKW